MIKKTISILTIMVFAISCKSNTNPSNSENGENLEFVTQKFANRVYEMVETPSPLTPMERYVKFYKDGSVEIKVNEYPDEFPGKVFEKISETRYEFIRDKFPDSFIITFSDNFETLSLKYGSNPYAIFQGPYVFKLKK